MTGPVTGTRVVLVVGGTDPSGGAGVQGDARAVLAWGLHPATAVTALTAQDGVRVRAWWPVDGAVVAAQLDAALSLRPAAVKVGMLGSAGAAGAVADALEAYAGPVVLDPVTRSSGGTDLLDAPGLAVLRDRLLPRATCVTPNLAEAGTLTGLDVRDGRGQRAAARALVALGAGAALVTGGHLDGDPCDVLWDGERETELGVARVRTAYDHGTGCALSSALACGLALGLPLERAAAAAQGWLAEGLAVAYAVGAGGTWRAVPRA